MAFIGFGIVQVGEAAVSGPFGSGSDDPPRPGRHGSAGAAALFSLPPFRTLTSGVDQGDRDPVVFSLQQQPFVEPPVRLRNDDPEYSRRIPLWSVGLRVIGTNALIWAVDRYIFAYSWARVGLKTWKKGINLGWEWDTDRFGMNFFFHPYSGASYFNTARANGYSYLESLPFVFLGSLTWEYFGETTRPAYNDIINTTVSGAFFGEILYRLSSSLLDDRTTGPERFFREFGASVLSPGRFFNRLLQGKLARHPPKEVYQKEPLNIALAAGAHWFNKGTTFGTGSTSALLNIHLEYGDPFEIRPRKTFDFFKVRIDVSYGKNVGHKYLDNVTGYGLLFGRTIHSGNLEMLIGAFQHYNYWDSKVFEIGTLGFGGGGLAKWRLSENSNLQTAFHLGLVPLAASNSPSIDIVEAGAHLRNYDYSGGWELKFESTLNLANRGQLTAIYYLYGLQTYIGPDGSKILGIFKPRIAVRLFKNLSLGAEYLSYQKHNYLRDSPDVHKSNSEQKLYLMLYY